MCECPKAVPEDPQYEENLPCPSTAGRCHGPPTRVAAHLLQEEEPAMTIWSQIGPGRAHSTDGAVDARRTDDAVTGRLLGELGAQELFRIAEAMTRCRGSAPLTPAWRAQFQRPDTRTLEENLLAERAGTGTLIPGEKDWPSALDDLATGGRTSSTQA